MNLRSEVLNVIYKLDHWSGLNNSKAYAHASRVLTSLIQEYDQEHSMLICDLIQDLRRFPQGARLIFCDKQILVDAAPHEKDGNTVFDVCCGDDDLPDDLRAAFTDVCKENNNG